MQKFGKGVQLLKNYQTLLHKWLPVHIIMLIFANSNFLTSLHLLILISDG
jgi:hypothetical protein